MLNATWNFQMMKADVNNILSLNVLISTCDFSADLNRACKVANWSTRIN
jgi:hypothetical protein